MALFSILHPLSSIFGSMSPCHLVIVSPFHRSGYLKRIGGDAPGRE